MRLLSAEGTRAQLEGLVHWDTQRASQGVDLTVNAIFRLSEPGRLDFGGNEFEPAHRSPLSPQKQAPEDRYGWWHLTPGTYHIRYNEELALAEDHVAHLTPLDRLVQAGAHHPAAWFDAARHPITGLLAVGTAGCHIKENSRISRLHVFEAA